MTEPVRLVAKPYANGILPFQSRSTKLVERFTELYKNDRVQTTNSLKGIPDNTIAERLVFLIVEVRQLNSGLYLVEVGRKVEFMFYVGILTKLVL